MVRPLHLLSESLIHTNINMEDDNNNQLHVFLLPFFHTGHLIPIVDLAKLLASRDITATIVTTPSIVARIQTSLDRSPHPVRLLTLPEPEHGLSFAGTEVTPAHFAYLKSLESPFEHLFLQHRPDCIVSDMFFPWTADLAAAHDIPRLIIQALSCFSSALMCALFQSEVYQGVEDPFVVPGIPHRIEMRRSQLMSGAPPGDMEKIGIALAKTYGVVANTFRVLEQGYNETVLYKKTWHVGPLSLCSRDTARGGQCDVDDSTLERWLDGKKPGSVIYVAFGSLGIFTASQLCEIAAGLVASGHPFIWVVRNVDEIPMPEGYAEEKGLIIRGWAPQVKILDHRAVGGFLTHGGWNSCLEGVSAGLPMAVWPLFSDQFLNEKLLVDVLKIGVPVGTMVCTDSVEKRTWIGREKVRETVEEVMGSGEEAAERRKRVRELAAAAAKAVEVGGSSHNDLSSLIQELKEVKAAKSISKGMN